MATQMDVEKLRREALRLSREDRVRLVTQLLESLDELLLEKAAWHWLEKARYRGGQIDCGEVGLISAEEVHRNARAPAAVSCGVHPGTSKS
jgi:hypothetical protein